LRPILSIFSEANCRNLGGGREHGYAESGYMKRGDILGLPAWNKLVFLTTPKPSADIQLVFIRQSPEHQKLHDPGFGKSSVSRISCERNDVFVESFHGGRVLATSPSPPNWRRLVAMRPKFPTEDSWRTILNLAPVFL